MPRPISESANCLQKILKGFKLKESRSSNVDHTSEQDLEQECGMIPERKEENQRHTTAHGNGQKDRRENVPELL